jgi:hypothetical protein
MHTVPQRQTLVGWAIVSSLSHRFGVGNSYFRVHSREPRVVDSVFGGCYRREVFARVGPFNEGLTRGQDMEFNLRLKRAGGRTLLVPAIESWYYARSDMSSFWRHNWHNGVWAILPFLHSRIMPVGWRHLMPMFFVALLIGLAAAAFVTPAAAWLLTVAAAAYGVAALIAGVDVAVRRRDARYLLLMPFVFASLHIAYGLGSLWGALKLAWSLATRRSAAAANPGPSEQRT